MLEVSRLLVQYQRVRVFQSRPVVFTSVNLELALRNPLLKMFASFTLEKILYPPLV